MKQANFKLDSNTSYSALVCYLVVSPISQPAVILILQKGGEKNILKGDRSFVEQRTWKMPMGHFNPAKDKDLIDAAIREFQEETGLALKQSDLSMAQSVPLRIRSDRPGHDFHEDRLFLVVANKMPPENKKMKKEEIIEEVRLFPLNSLPLDHSPASGATMARGQRKKLAYILVELQNSLVKQGVKLSIIQETLKSLLFRQQA